MKVQRNEGGKAFPVGKLLDLLVRGDSVILAVPNLYSTEQRSPLGLVTRNGISSPRVSQHGYCALRLSQVEQLKGRASRAEEGDVLAPNGSVDHVVSVFVLN